MHGKETNPQSFTNRKPFQANFREPAEDLWWDLFQLGWGFCHCFQCRPQTKVGTLHSIRCVIIVQVLCFWA